MIVGADKNNTHVAVSEGPIDITDALGKEFFLFDGKWPYGATAAVVTVEQAVRVCECSDYENEEGIATASYGHLIPGTEDAVCQIQFTGAYADMQKVTMCPLSGSTIAGFVTFYERI